MKGNTMSDRIATEPEKIAKIFLRLPTNTPAATRGLFLHWLENAFAVADMTAEDRAHAALLLAGYEIAAIEDDALRAAFLKRAPSLLAEMVQANREAGPPIRGDLAKPVLMAPESNEIN